MNKLWKTPLIVFVLVFLIGIFSVNLVSAEYYLGVLDSNFTVEAGTDLGISVNGSNIAIAVRGSGVFIYDMEGNYIKDWPMTSLVGNSVDIANNISNWFISSNDGNLYNYDVNGNYIGTIPNAGGGGAYGNIVTNNTNFWKTNSSSVVGYDMVGTQIHNFLSPSPKAIAMNGSNLFILNTSLSVNIYNFDGTVTGSKFNLDAGNTDVYGADLYGDYFYTIDDTLNSVFKYLIGNRKIFNNGESYNSQSYEMLSETFTINVTANSSLTAANLIYKGIPYVGTNLGGGIWNRTIEIPLGSANNDFYWSFTYAGEIINLTTHTQTVNYSTLILCNATYPTAYLNFTFKDESTSTLINASVDLATFDYWLGSGTVTKEYIFQNNTDHFNYAFCFSPADKSLTIDLSFKYSKTSYPQRTFVYENKLLTNSSTNRILYLLGSADGIYSTLQFLDAGTNSPISGVEVTAEREISGIWTLVAQGQTDSAGSITFWVNPDYEHRITGIKTGYAGVSETITPTQTSYTVFMGTSTNVSIPGYLYKNIRYMTYPGSGRLEPNTDYTFGFNITANDGNIVSCKIEIRNLTSSVVATSLVGCGAYGGNMSVTYNTGTNSKLFGYYYVDLGEGLELFKANDAWFVEYQNVTSTGGLIGFFEALGDLPEWGETHNRQEFSKVVFFFFIMIFMVGIFTFFSGYDLSSPGSALIMVWGFIAFGSVSGILNVEGLSPFSWWNQYGIFIIVSFIFFGFILNTMRREAQ